MNPVARTFFLFSGLHALLIGMLPFYLPVLAWEGQFSIADVVLVIALSGTSFSLCLPLWKAISLKANTPVPTLLLVSFVLVCLLLSALIWLPLHSMVALISVGIINGAYGCFYWTTQRFLFNAFTHSQSSGNQFGNFQLLVAIMLKIGILAGGFLIERELSWIILSLALVVSVFGLIWMSQSVPNDLEIFKEYRQKQATARNTSSLQTRAKLNLKTKVIFAVDGLFLFLESFFWVLSLYWLMHSDAESLGLLAVSIAVILAIVFLIIKKRIDRSNAALVFTLGTLLYSASWYLRYLFHGTVIDQGELTVLALCMVLMIAFCTSFFRLAFNKQFFDYADSKNIQIGTYQYFMTKSYWSQSAVAIFFGIFWLTLIKAHNSIPELHPMASLISASQGTELQTVGLMYLMVCPLALIFCFYNEEQTKPMPNLTKFGARSAIQKQEII